MPVVSLGTNGPKVQPLRFGTMGVSVFYGLPKPDEERLHVLDEMYVAGERFWDTADMYGDSDELVDGNLTLSKKKNGTSGQLTLAWLMAQGPDIIPIPRETMQRRIWVL